MRSRIQLIVVLAAVAAVGCATARGGPAEPAAAAKGPVRVTLLLYSGRPNPVFVVDEAFAAEKLRAPLAKASPVEAEKRAPTPPGLGYGGIRVENLGRVQGLPASFVVFHEDVEAREDSKRTFRRDASRDVEKALLREAVAKGVIDAKVAEAIEGP